MGFRTDLNFGPTADIVNSFEPAGSETFRHLQQAYVSYLAPVGKGLQIDAGKFVTQLERRSLRPRTTGTTRAPCCSRLQFLTTISGSGPHMPINDKLSLSGYLVNGWNDVTDNNTSKTVGVSATIKPTSKFTWINNYMAGAEQTRQHRRLASHL